MDVEQINPFELVITSTKELEALLVKGWNADGDGVIQKVNSVQDQLPRDLVGRIRYLGGVRNKLVHESNFNALDVAKYQLEYIQAKSVLEFLIGEQAAAHRGNESVPPVHQQVPRSASTSPVQHAEKLGQAFKDINAQNQELNSKKLRGFPWLVFLGCLALAFYFNNVVGGLAVGFFLILTYVPLRIIKRLFGRGDFHPIVWFVIWGFILFNLDLPGYEIPTSSKTGQGSIQQVTPQASSKPQSKLPSNLITQADLGPVKNDPLKNPNTPKMVSNQQATHAEPTPIPAPVVSAPKKIGSQPAKVSSLNSGQTLQGKLEAAKSVRKNSFDKLNQALTQGIIDNAKVSVGVPQYNDNGNGTFDLSVLAQWNISASVFEEAFRDAISYSTQASTGRIIIYDHNNENEKMLKPFSSDLYKELLKHIVALEFRLGGHKNKITLATGRKCFVACEGLGDDEYQIHYSNSGKPKDLLYSAYQGQQNPIILKGVPESVLTSGESLQVFIVGRHFETKVAEVHLNPSTTQSALAASRSDKQDALEQLESGIFQYIEDNIEIDVSSIDLNPKASGLYDAHVTVKWNVNDRNKITSLLNRYFDLRNGGRSFRDSSSNVIEINKFSNKDERQKLPYTWDLYNALLKYKAEIVVSIGKKRQTITLATGRKCFVSCEKGFGKDKYQMHLSNWDSVSDLLYSAYQGEQNPVIIGSLTEADLKNNVSAQLKWGKRY